MVRDGARLEAFTAVVGRHKILYEGNRSGKDSRPSNDTKVMQVNPLLSWNGSCHWYFVWRVVLREICDDNFFAKSPLVEILAVFLGHFLDHLPKKMAIACQKKNETTVAMKITMLKAIKPTRRPITAKMTTTTTTMTSSTGPASLSPLPPPPLQLHESE